MFLIGLGAGFLAWGLIVLALALTEPRPPDSLDPDP